MFEWTPLHEAAECGHLEMVKHITKHLENKNPPDNGGITPLHLAAEHGHLDVFKYLEKFLDDKNQFI